MNLDKIIKELQERNREEAKSEKISLMELTSDKDYGIAITYKKLDQLTTDTAHAVALAVIGEIQKAKNPGGWEDQSWYMAKCDMVRILENHLTTK